MTDAEQPDVTISICDVPGHDGHAARITISDRTSAATFCLPPRRAGFISQALAQFAPASKPAPDANRLPKPSPRGEPDDRDEHADDPPHAGTGGLRAPPRPPARRFPGIAPIAWDELTRKGPVTDIPVAGPIAASGLLKSW